MRVGIEVGGTFTDLVAIGDDGSVTVANEPDGGARFDVRLPFGGAR